jgi:hypothetical protein
MEIKNEEQKPYIYRWREANKERYLEISRKGSSKYYEKNKEKKKAYAREYYQRKRSEKLSLENSKESHT